MDQTESGTWVSCYLYYIANPDELLVKKVWPLVTRLTSEQLSKQFFFIRYADARGPHIRLRLLPATAESRQTMVRHVKTAFPDVLFVAYVPEVERYGGSAGVPIAERLFEASSKAVLQVIGTSKTWNYQRALASALQLHIGMLQGFGVSRSETANLLGHVSQKDMFKSSAVLYKKGFAAQPKTTAMQLRVLWEACERDKVTDSWFSDWRRAMARLGEDLQDTHKARQLVLPKSSQHDSPLWYLYESYIHMTNNRLGLSRKDEPFAAYILSQSLR